MNFPENNVLIRDYQDRIDVIIKMVHPKWIVNLLIAIFIACLGLLLYGFVVFNIFEAMGPAALILVSFYLFIMYRLARIICWHKYGEEVLILTDLAFSFVRNYGIYQTKIETISDPHYEIVFLETTSREEKDNPIGKLVLCHVDPISKLESLLFETALDITYDDFVVIETHFLKLRAPEDFLFKNDIIPN